MNLYDEFFTIIRHFNRIGIRYAVIGGIAMAFHELPRFTKDIDLLVSPNDDERVSTLFAEMGFVESSDPWTFQQTDATLRRFLKVDGEDYLIADILIGREERHLEIITRASAEPSEQGVVKIARREDLIWLKQIRNSDQDQVDIRKLKDDSNREGD